MSQFKVLHISNNLDKYPECSRDSNEHPELVNWVHGEYQMFIYNLKTGSAFQADSFFKINEHVTKFRDANYTDLLEDELQFAIMYIQSTKAQILDARTNNGDIHEAIISMIKDCPMINNKRIILRDEDRTYLAIKNEHIL